MYFREYLGKNNMQITVNSQCLCYIFGEVGKQRQRVRFLDKELKCDSHLCAVSRLCLAAASSGKPSLITVAYLGLPLALH